MKTLFDTSVLVPALVDQLANHTVCFSAFLTGTSGENTGYCSTHALAECYSVLTALPLRRRVTPGEARRLIAESVMARVTVVDLTTADYREALQLVADAGRVSGVAYDALHLVAAKNAECDRILTYNTRHFLPIQPENISVSAP